MNLDPRERFDQLARPPAPVPVHVHYHRGPRLVELVYDAGELRDTEAARLESQGVGERRQEQLHYRLPVELLRVFSPSAEVRGHSPDQAVLQTGKRDVSLLDIESVGNYALKLSFDDGHDSGLYTWAFLFELALHQETWWRHYLKELEDAGASRVPPGIQIKQL
ncbi:gamma-butyrobetaine hydroxylase-like domain-containing protein [Halotalea alkalilenta]|uniref:Gamma-butyrobetaine hydroxylase-like N-terminal domain-containing protein n=1 Tax=Halotalea alkalilenta TaxID=376489 RepID=A0A172YCY2_9GAMM|nr:DUF971 domain-containing protein [Halotalea alkalilenta]ANF56976.1 hypothetical protein A5892_05440 [Halotalea alkalilenta]